MREWYPILDCRIRCYIISYTGKTDQGVDAPKRRVMKGSVFHGGDRGRGGVRRLALLWVFVLALLGHSIATQAHIHLGTPDAGASARPGAALLSGKFAGDRSGECLICWEKAQAGTYLAPAAAVFASGAAIMFAIGLSRLADLACRAHRHDWRSRAPPSARRA